MLCQFPCLEGTCLLCDNFFRICANDKECEFDHICDHGLCVVGSREDAIQAEYDREVDEELEELEKEDEIAEEKEEELRSKFEEMEALDDDEEANVENVEKSEIVHVDVDVDGKISGEEDDGIVAASKLFLVLLSHVEDTFSTSLEGFFHDTRVKSV